METDTQKLTRLFKEVADEPGIEYPKSRFSAQRRILRLVEKHRNAILRPCDVGVQVERGYSINHDSDMIVIAVCLHTGFHVPFYAAWVVQYLTGRERRMEKDTFALNKLVSDRMTQLLRVIRKLIKARLRDPARWVDDNPFADRSDELPRILGWR